MGGDVVDVSYCEAGEGDRRFVCSQKEGAEAQPRPARPPPWRDKCNGGSEQFVACNSVQRHQATSQEGVKKNHLCLRLPINSLWEALKMKAWSPHQFMDVTAKNIIMKVRIWITVMLTVLNRVAKVNVEPNATSWTHSWSSRLHVRMSKKSSWNGHVV